jgi:hypothetical protein
LGVNFDWNTAAVISNSNRPILVNGHAYVSAEPDEGFIDRVVDDLKDKMMQTSGVGAADVHGRPFPNSFQVIQYLDLIR